MAQGRGNQTGGWVRKRGQGHAKCRRLEGIIKHQQYEIDRLRKTLEQMPSAVTLHPQPHRSSRLPLQPTDSRHSAFPQLGACNTVTELLNATVHSGREAVRQRRISAGFHSNPVDTDVLLFNYTDGSAGNFVGQPSAVQLRRHILDGFLSEQSAQFRRECRGLVVHRSGGVLARPLHKFFTLDQLLEVNSMELSGREIELVTRKLDGQMVYGIMVGGFVQFWTRSGDTTVGQEAGRAVLTAAGDYPGFVRHVSSQQCTATFEYVGKRSHKKAFDGHMPRLVLLAVRYNNSGVYWRYPEMLDSAQKFGVEVVERLQCIWSSLAFTTSWHRLETGTTAREW